MALKAEGDRGSGEVSRTLRVCGMLAEDSQPKMVQAVAWALRELVPHDPGALEGFLRKHERVRAAPITRQVRTRLRSGLKTPVRGRP